MHTLLSVEDIVSAVFRLLKRGDVARCGRVCRTWFPLAIKIVWESVDFDCLLKSVNIDIGKLGNTANSEEGVRHWCPIDAEGNRLYLYSGHVRRLDLTYSSDGLPENPELLSSSPGGGLLEQQDASRRPLFPLARQFCCRLARSNRIPISIVLGHLPQLTKFDISFDSALEAKVVNSFWASFRMICPALISLKLSIRQRPCEMGKFWNSFAEALLLCVNLEELICGFQVSTINTAVTHAVAALPNLRKIEGSFDSTPCFDDGWLGSRGTTRIFPQLEELVMNMIHTIESAQVFWIPPDSLRAFTCTDPLAEDGFHEIICWLSSKQPLVTRLSLCVWSSIQRIHDIGSLHCLQSLSISILVGEVMTTDDDIALLAAELPDLRVIELSSCSRVDHPTLTLQAIHHLVNSCPNLHTIMMDFDATLIPPTCISLSPQASDGPPQSRTQYSSLLLLIPLAGVPIVDPNAVAHWLSYHCGRYSEVIIDRNDNLEVGEHWAEVQRLVNHALYTRRAKTCKKSNSRYQFREKAGDIGGVM